MTQLTKEKDIMVQTILILIDKYGVKQRDLFPEFSVTEVEQEQIPYNQSPIIPLYYTEKEGGKWKPWEGGTVSLSSLHYSYLNARCNNKYNINEYTVISGLVVHTLEFGEFTQSNFPRWDCINQWTTKLPSAKESSTDEPT